MRIGTLASRCGLTTKTIRYYESIGLLAEPERSPSGYRQYGDDAVQRLQFVTDAQCAGLSLTEIRSVLELKDAGASSCEHTLALLERHIDDIDDQMARLRIARAELVQARRAGAISRSGRMHRSPPMSGRHRSIRPADRRVVAGGRS